jgi:hypothetical protein
MLPSDHELVGFDPEDLDRHFIVPMEGKLFEALRKEAENPSPENLPSDGSMVRRDSIDESGRHIVTWLGRESFIKSRRSSGRRRP